MINPASNLRRLPNTIIDRRVTMKMFVSGTLVNFQGDPDNANHPRIDSEGLAYMTPMGWKRKYRDTSVMMGYGIHVCRGQELAAPVLALAAKLGLDIVEDDAAPEQKDAQKADTKKKGDKAATDLKAGVKRRKKGHALGIDEKNSIVKLMGDSYWDFKAFGGTLTSINHGETGAIQPSFGVTIDPVDVMDLTIGRVAVANAKELETKDRTMGSLTVCRYGLMQFDISISPFNAARTGLTWGDYEVFLDIIVKMWDNTKSTGRGKVVVEKLVSFIHSSPLGDIQDARLTDAVQATWVSKREGDLYPRSFKDYVISIDRAAIPKSVEVIDIPV
jgi:Cas7 group CRISPR-associated protein Csh2